MSDRPHVESAVEDEDVQELRLALMMSGGVSLAVWMGGVAHEFHRVTRADGPVYEGLLKLTSTRARIDVISGTSAGGLNGALLAMAIVHDSTLGRLRDLWLRLGSLEDLLRRAGEKDPPSLMRGDDYFTPEITKALAELRSSTTPPAEVPMDLTITTTLLRARSRGLADHFGTIIHDADHRGEFAFRRGRSVTSLGLDTQERDDFANPEIVAQLALASRSTASFPFAFEASYCPSNPSADAPDGRPDMGGRANFENSRYVIDGGVLVNRPLRPALRAIFAQPAGPQVRRVLAYVVPDPGQGRKDGADAQDEIPEVSEIAFASLISLPRNQSVGSEIDAINEHNARVDAQRRRRELSVVALDDVEGFARNAYLQYREVRASRLAEWLFASLAQWLTALELRRPDQVQDAPLWQGETVKGQLTTHLRTLPPDTFPQAGHAVEEWFTTVDTVERAGAVVLDLLRRGLGVTDPADPATRNLRRKMQGLRAQVHGLVRYARTLRQFPGDVQQRAYALQAVESLGSEDPPAALGGWADGVMATLLGEPRELTAVAAQIAENLAPALRVVSSACAAAPPHLRPRAEQTERYAEGLGRGLVGQAVPGQAALQRLLALEVVELVLGDEPTVEQRVELIQVSADAGNGFDAREKPEDKLAGLQLGHFGAFYKRSWRANDWLWGRLDGAQRLSQVLLEPSRLRQQGFSASQAYRAIEALALGEEESKERETLEKADWPRRWDADGALRELAFLDDPASELPDSLPICAQALSRRLQLQILHEELGPIAEAVRWDRESRATIGPDAAAFERAEADSKPLTPAAAVSLFKRCQIGKERLPAEAGSDLLARTVSRTLAVSTATVSGRHMGLPARAQGFLRALRGIALVFHLFVSHALSRTGAGASLAAATLAAGAALVAVGLVVRIPGILLLLGAALVLGAIVLAAYRQNWKRPWPAILWAVAVAASPRIAIWTGETIDDGSDRPGWVGFLEVVEPVVVVGGLLLGAHLLGKAAIPWPAREEREVGLEDIRGPRPPRARAPERP